MAQIKTITPEKIQTLRYPLPKSWIKAAGILRRKKRRLELHVLKIKKEWDRGSIKQ